MVAEISCKEHINQLGYGNNSSHCPSLEVYHRSISIIVTAECNSSLHAKTCHRTTELTVKNILSFVFDLH